MKTYQSVSIAFFSAILLSGCQTSDSPNSAELKDRVAVLEQKLKDSEAKNSSSASSDATTPKEQSATPTVTDESEADLPEANPTEADELEAGLPEDKPTAAAESEAGESEASPPEEETKEEAADSSPNERLVNSVDFSNFPDPERLQEIVSFDLLAKTGITSQAELENEITRGQYVAMVVDMNNFLFDTNSGKSIRLARGGTQTFTDVPADHPYYKHIQGMVDAGYVIGFNENTFRPDKTLTREEMIAIAAKRDYQLKPERADSYWRLYSKWTDREDIAPKYRLAVSFDASRRAKSNSKQAFGDTKLLKPKQAVKAYEAVLSLYKLGNHGNYIYKKKVKEAAAK